MTVSPPPTRRLSRSDGDTAPAAPIRIVHLGLGNFFRAHQAFYTATAPDAAAWGIAAFTGRSVALADALTRQDGLFTLVTRAADGDTAQVIGSLAAAHPGPDHAAWLGYLADPQVCVVTVTVTEAGYLLGADGHLDIHNTDVNADLVALQADFAAPVRTAPARLVAGLIGRRAVGDGPLAVVSCDNLPGNGAVTSTVVTEFAALLDPALRDWIARHVSFVTTTVDRITPATTDQDAASAAELTGRLDLAPVITEPYREWVLCGHFPAGRPSWEEAGARFVDDITPTSTANCGCSTAGIRCWPMPAARAVTTPSPKPSPIRSVGNGSTTGGMWPRQGSRCCRPISPPTGTP